MARALMIQGTASHAGKSVLTAAFACWLRRQGLAVASFKAQNMSLNSYVTMHGEEIARSQAVQAEALGLEPTADMNPILLKPLAEGCQVIVQGRGAGVMSIHEYYAFKGRAWNAIAQSYDRLAGKFDAVVLEGAGSPAEINLREHDLVNMRMAHHASAAVVLVADIERGGVFAQLIGTWELLEPADRRRIVGFLINKFRGDASLLHSGLEYVRQRTGKPVLGVLPHTQAVQLDEEDSLGLEEEPAGGEIEIAVLRLPGLSNFTDFAALQRLAAVSVRFVSHPGQVEHPDLVVLPGTRTTIRALDWLRATGLDAAVRRLAARPDGPLILGLCGGYQLLGTSIADPEGVESARAEDRGLGLLPVATRFAPRKTLFRVEGMVAAGNGPCAGCPVVGYEIHQGVSRLLNGTRAWLQLHRQPGGEVVGDGAVSDDGRVCGTYVHGLFDDARFCRRLIETLRSRRGLPPLEPHRWLSQREYWQQRYAGLPAWLAVHCDLAPVAHALGLTSWNT